MIKEKASIDFGEDMGKVTTNVTSEAFWYEEKIFNELSCEDLFLIENKRILSGDSPTIVKKIIVLKGCRIS